MNNKILITGGAGFIGSHLVDLLLEDGVEKDKLVLLIPTNESLHNLHHSNLNIIRGDIRNHNDVKKAMVGINVVYHLAAKTSLDGKTYNDFKDTNVEGTRILLSFCKKSLKKFVYFSSIGIYGFPADIGDIVNWDESQPKHPSEGYGQTKLEAEKFVTDFCLKGHIPFTIIRPSTVYGPRGSQGIAELCKVIKNGFFFFVGSGKNKMDYVYVKDLVKGARQAELSSRKSSDYILGANKPITFEYMVKTIAKNLNKTVPLLHVPKLPVLGLSYIFSYIEKLTGVRLPLSPERVKVISSNCYYNIGKAKREFGYQPETSFDQGCIETIQWLESSNR